MYKKVCIKCKKEKEEDKFFYRKGIGLSNVCRECRNLAARIWDRKSRLENPERELVKRARRKEKQSAYYKEWYAKNGRLRSHEERIAIEEWQIKNPEKKKAHIEVAAALRKGVLVRPKTCEKCGLPSKVIVAHHKDYYRPLDVQWVCVSCHRLIHFGVNYFPKGVPGKKTGRAENVGNKKIIERIAQGESICDIANDIGVSRQRIYQIKKIYQIKQGGKIQHA